MLACCYCEWAPWAFYYMHNQLSRRVLYERWSIINRGGGWGNGAFKVRWRCTCLKKQSCKLKAPRLNENNKNIAQYTVYYDCWFAASIAVNRLGACSFY